MDQYEYSEDNARQISDRIIQVREYLESIDSDWTIEGSISSTTNRYQTSTRSVLSYGPGTGKTTKILQFCLNNYDRGIVIATKTISESHKLYRDILDYSTYKNIKLSCLCINSSDVDEYMKYSIDTNYAKNYDILLVTHAFLMNESPASYSKYLGKDYDAFDRDIRDYLIIDEYPDLYKPFKGYNRQVSFNLSVSGPFDLFPTDKEGNHLTPVIPPLFRNSGMTRLYEGLRSLREDHKSQNSLSDIARFVLKDMGISKKPCDMSYREFMNVMWKISIQLSEDTNLLNNNFSMSTLYEVNPKYSMNLSMLLNPHILILDGTGDRSFNGSKDWTIINGPHRSIECSMFQILSFDAARNNTNIPTLNNSLKNIETRVEHCLNSIPPDQELLIVGWKNIKTKSGSESVDLEKYLTERFNRIQFTHYQSGNTRATNEFRDISNILILGSFHIPQSVVSEQRKVINSDSYTSVDHSLSECKQAIFRTSARRGLPVRVFITDDWGRDFIEDLVDYSSMKLPDDFDYLETSIRDRVEKLPSGRRSRVKKILDYLGYESELNITLDELYSMMPMSQKIVSKYYPLVDLMKTIGVNLRVNK